MDDTQYNIVSGARSGPPMPAMPGIRRHRRVYYPGGYYQGGRTIYGGGGAAAWAASSACSGADLRPAQRRSIRPPPSPTTAASSANFARGPRRTGGSWRRAAFDPDYPYRGPALVTGSPQGFNCS